MRFGLSDFYTLRFDSNMAHLYSWFLGIMFVMLLLMIYGYNTNIAFRENLRFGFEGFFSLVEEGKWDVHSNEILKNMYVFPDNLKTWIIGDGYFDNPNGIEPYYIGPTWHGYYQNTDVGYLRFIYYFGLAGLIAFILFMIKASKVCMNRFASYRSLFFVILLLNFIVWFKVSTDIFLVFALFLCLDKDDGQMAVQKSL